MKNIILIIALTILPLSAHAEYFFIMNPGITTACDYTGISDKAVIRASMEKTLGTSCQRPEFVEGTYLILCKEEGTVVGFSLTEKACKQTRKELLTILLGSST